MSESLTLVPVTEAHLDWLVELRVATMTEHLERSGEHVTIQDQRDRVLRDFDATRIVQLGAESAGMIKVVREPDLWHLVQIQIRPQHQRSYEMWFDPHDSSHQPSAS